MEVPRIGSEEEVLLIDQQLKQARLPKYVFQHETNPRHPFDKTMWPGLRVVMNTFAKGKMSHWWHWYNLPEDTEYVGRIVSGNPEAFSVLSANPTIEKLKMVRMSLGGWNTAYVIAPDTRQMDPQVLTQGYRYAFAGTSEDIRQQYCSIILHSPVKILTGPNDFRVVGIEAYSFHEIPLLINGPFPDRGWIPIV